MPLAGHAPDHPGASGSGRLLRRPDDAGGHCFGAAGGSALFGGAIASAFGAGEPHEPHESQQEPQLSQQEFRLPSRPISRLRKPSFSQHGLQVLQQGVGQQVVGQQVVQGLLSPQQPPQTVTGTSRHFLTHTSSGTQTLTFLQTVQGTISVTW